MIKAIINNPYRILGVFADASESEILAASDRLLSSPNMTCETDFCIDCLPKPKRSSDVISTATKTILNSTDAFIYKLFWFVRPLDEACLSYLKEGKITEARKGLALSTRKEAEHNLMICCLFDEMYDQVARLAHKIIFSYNYCQTVLSTKRSSSDVLNRFKDQLFDASNDVLTPPGLAMSWKQYLQNKIFNGLSNIIKTSYLLPAKLMIKEGVPSTYINALSTLSLSWQYGYLPTLQRFIDNTDNRYKLFMQDVVDSAQEWIEVYLDSSKDVLKHRTVYSKALIFYPFAPNRIQSSYLNAIGSFLGNTGSFLMSSDIFQICYSTAYKLFHFYSRGDISSHSYRSLLEQTSSSISEVQKTLGRSNSCYSSLANLMAGIGLEIINRELTGNITDQIVKDSGSILYCIDNIIDRKFLYNYNVELRGSCLIKLSLLGLNSSPNSKQGGERDTRQKYKTTTKTTESGVNAASLHSNQKTTSLIKASSVLKFITLALIIEVIFGLLLGNTAMLSVGLVLAFGYILVIFLAEKGYDKEAKKTVCIYLIAQVLVTIVGFLAI